jgi:DNA-binding MarR family transcriptional regulator
MTKENGSRYDIISYGETAVIPPMDKLLSQDDYQALAELRHHIREFLHFSEEAARVAGLEPRQHQFMLALKGLPLEVRPRVGELAARLKIQHHSAVELVNRLARGGLVRRHRGKGDRREVLLSLTGKGEKVLRELSLHHRTELQTRGPALVAALQRAMKPGKNAAAEEVAGQSKKGPKNRSR